MKRHILLALLLSAAMFATGCFSTTFQYSSRAPAGQAQEAGRAFLIRGLINLNDPLRAYDYCPSGVQSVETVHTFGDMFLGCLTASIYTPNTVKVTCASGAAHNFFLDENDSVVARQSVDASGAVVSEEIVTNDTL